MALCIGISNLTSEVPNLLPQAFSCCRCLFTEYLWWFFHSKVCWLRPWATLSWQTLGSLRLVWWIWPPICMRVTWRRTPGSLLTNRWGVLIVVSLVASVPLTHAGACAGVWYSRIHRPRGDPSAGVWEASRLVGDGGHPLRVPRWLRSLFRRHPRRAFWTSCQWWAA